MTVLLHILRQNLTIASLLTYNIDGTANNKQINSKIAYKQTAAGITYTLTSLIITTHQYVNESGCLRLDIVVSLYNAGKAEAMPDLGILYSLNH